MDPSGVFLFAGLSLGSGTRSRDETSHGVLLSGFIPRAPSPFGRTDFGVDVNVNETSVPEIVSKTARGLVGKCTPELLVGVAQ
jgi:hypothetical protein